MRELKTTGCILAGGLARRMGGGDKALLAVAGRTLLEHVVDRLSPQVEHVVLNANGPPQRFAQFELPVAADPVGGRPGPLAGILAGMRWCQTHDPETTLLATVSTDAPLIPHDLVARLAEARARAGASIALAQSGGILHPVIGLWLVNLADDLEQALASGVRKVLDWTGRHAVATEAFAAVQNGGHSYDPFFNANTPDELAELERFMEAIT